MEHVSSGSCDGCGEVSLQNYRKNKEKIMEGCTFVRVRVEDLSVYADIFLKSHCNVTFEDQNKKKFFIFLKCPDTGEKMKKKTIKNKEEQEIVIPTVGEKQDTTPLRLKHFLYFHQAIRIRMASSISSLFQSSPYSSLFFISDTSFKMPRAIHHECIAEHALI